MNSARLNAIRKTVKRVIRCVTTGEIFPTAQIASISMGLPSACVSEVLTSYNGYYKKKDLHFESVQIEAVSDEELMPLVDHFLRSFQARRGGRKC